ANHQKQIALAILEYETSHHQFPAGRLGCDDTGDTMAIPQCPPGLTSQQKTAASGLVLVLPQLDQQPLYDQLAVHSGGLWNRNVDDLSWYYYNPGKYRAIKEVIPLLRCPSDRSEPKSDVYDPVVAATTSYALVQGSLGPGDPARLAK